MKTILAAPPKTDVPKIPIKTLLDRDPDDAFTNHLHWFKSEDIEYSCLFHPSQTLQFAVNLLNPEQFDYCCQRDTHRSLACFGEIMTDELFAICFRYDPASALVWQTDRLTKMQFDRCVREHPIVVLEYYPCHHRLTINHLKYFIRECPQSVLEHAEYLLTDAQFEYCSRRAPLEAMVYMWAPAQGRTASLLLSAIPRFCARKAAEPNEAKSPG